MPERRVEILNGVPGNAGTYLDQVYERATGRYFVPIHPQHPFFEGVKGVHRSGFTGSGVKSAIIDTGIMLDHPVIKGNVIGSEDFTGEGVEDLNGHGTMVALLYLLSAPAAKLLNVKVMDREGRGSEENLIQGIRWSVAQGVRIINMSVGVYWKKWGLFECKGDCKLCLAAVEAAQAGVVIVAASGNEPGKTYCPAKAGMVGNDVLSLASWNFERNKPAPSSGVGNVMSPGEGGLWLTPMDQ